MLPITQNSNQLQQTQMVDNNIPFLHHFSPAKRWRSVFAALRFTRAFFSLSTKALHHPTQLLHLLSYTFIDVRDSEHLPLNSAVDKSKLAQMVRNKNYDSLNQLGGVQGVAVLLQSDENAGISGHENNLKRRRDLYGTNRYQMLPDKSFSSFVFHALKETTILILLAFAIISLGVGVKQDGLKNGWYDGGSSILAVFTVVLVSAGVNFKQSVQFKNLDQNISSMKVKVLRDGMVDYVFIFDVVVGDVVSLNKKDQVPADGLLLKGHNSLKIDESSITGDRGHLQVSSSNPFLISGAKVTDGFCYMLVTAVGMDTSWGEMMSSISCNLDQQKTTTPLESRLRKLTTYFGVIGFVGSVVAFVVWIIRWSTILVSQKDDRHQHLRVHLLLRSLVCIMAASVTIAMEAFPEGLPLPITLTLAYSIKQMMSDIALVRKLSACETIGSATTICTGIPDRTLPSNHMKVEEFWFGKELIDCENGIKAEPAISLLLEEGIYLNSTRIIKEMSSELTLDHIPGRTSPIEKALISWANLRIDINETKKKCEVIRFEAFKPEINRRGVIMMRRNIDRAIYMHCKGFAEMILDLCSSYYDKNGTIADMKEEERAEFKAVIDGMKKKSLLCFALACKKVDGGYISDHQDIGEENEFTLLGIAGLRDPFKEAVESCKKAQVNVKLITDDGLQSARAIAIQSGILSPEDEVNTGKKTILSGFEFRNYSEEERRTKVDEIRVMASSSPSDKRLIVECLKKKDHVVTFTGNNMNDALAMNEADVGVAWGDQRTEQVAKDSSDISFHDGSFISLVEALKLGRCVHSNIEKVMQFQITYVIVALFINFSGAVTSFKIPLTAIELLWVKLISATLGALALASEPPTDDLMTKPPPAARSSPDSDHQPPVITGIMWRNLIAQILFQLTILLTLEFKGKTIFSVDEKVKSTMVFNVFVLCQIFNEVNSRNLEKKNIFKGIHKNKLFFLIIGMTLVLQALIVELLQKYAGTKRLNWEQWGVCIGIAALCLPIGCLVKLIPA